MQYYSTIKGNVGGGATKPLIVLEPEYAGAVLTNSGASNDAGELGMTSDLWNSGNDFKNYYEWRSDITTGLQSNDVFVQIPIPYNFQGFQTGVDNAFEIDICTEENTTTNNKIDITLQVNGDATTSSLTDQKSSVAASWETLGFDDSNAVLSTVVAGDILNVRNRMYSQNSKYVRIGAITLRPRYM